MSHHDDAATGVEHEIPTDCDMSITDMAIKKIIALEAEVARLWKENDLLFDENQRLIAQNKRIAGVVGMAGGDYCSKCGREL